MKKFKLQLQDIDGNIQDEKDLELGENDVLVMQIPDGMPMDEAYHAFKNLKTAMDGGIVGIPSKLSFFVIKQNG